MATFREHRGKVQVQIRLANHPATSRHFPTLKEAQKWAKAKEAELQGLNVPNSSNSGTPTNPKAPKAPTSILKDVVDKYHQEVRGCKSYKSMYRTYLNQLAAHPIGQKPTAELRFSDLAQFRNERLEEGVSPVTVKRQFYIYRKMFRVAKEEWDIPFENLDIDKVRHKAKEKERVARFEPIDIETVVEDIWRRNKVSDEHKQLYQDCFMFVILTGLRRGELLKVLPKHYSKRYKTLSIPDTKNGEDRIIGLHPLAIEIIERRLDTERCFPVNVYALQSLFRRLFKRVGLTERRWHDTRHEALSAYFEKGLTTPEVRNQSGHKSIASLNRYVHHKLSSIVEKLGRDYQLCQEQQPTVRHS